MEPDHQVVIRMVGHKTTVSCQCRAVFGKHSRNPPGDYFEPMVVKEGETIWDTYNEAFNHNTPFLRTDRINT